MYLIYVNLHLKISKTATFHHGCDILLTATGQVACQVASLMQYLKLSRPRPSDYPLFHLLDGSPPTRSHYVKLLQDSVQSAGYSVSGVQRTQPAKRVRYIGERGKNSGSRDISDGQVIATKYTSKHRSPLSPTPSGGSGPWNRGG